MHTIVALITGGNKNVTHILLKFRTKQGISITTIYAYIEKITLIINNNYGGSGTHNYPEVATTITRLCNGIPKLLDD